MALHFQLEMRKLSFGFHASTISYKSIDKLPFFSLDEKRYHLSFISQMRQWNGPCLSPWHDIELTSHILAKVHLQIRLLSTPPYARVIGSGHIASCLFIPCFSYVLLTPDYVAITLCPSEIRDACVKVIPCEKTPACSQ